MYGMQLGLALAMLGATSEHAIVSSEFGIGRPVTTMGATVDSVAASIPAPWLQGDPADSLYRAARETLNRRDYRTAANLFAQITTRFPRSGYVGDALYWQAFALYRLGGDRDLHEALAALRLQRARFPQAATHGDATALERRSLMPRSADVD